MAWFVMASVCYQHRRSWRPMVWIPLEAWYRLSKKYFTKADNQYLKTQLTWEPNSLFSFTELGLVLVKKDLKDFSLFTSQLTVLNNYLVLDTTPRTLITWYKLHVMNYIPMAGSKFLFICNFYHVSILKRDSNLGPSYQSYLNLELLISPLSHHCWIRCWVNINIASTVTGLISLYFCKGQVSKILKNS